VLWLFCQAMQSSLIQYVGARTAELDYQITAALQPATAAQWMTTSGSGSSSSSSSSSSSRHPYSRWSY